MSNFSSVDYFYLVCAVIGSLLFLLRLGLSIFGGEAGNVDTDMVSEVAHLDSADAHHVGDPGFQLFSLQGITGFFIMFGLVGLALSRAGGQIVWTALGGVAAGGMTMVVIAGIVYYIQRLQSEGTLHMENTVGKEGIVYLTIPENGTGQVSVVVQGGLRQFDAVSSAGQRIPTGDKIRVVRVVSSRILVVEPLEVAKSQSS